MSGLWSGWLTRTESLALGWTLLHFCWQGAAIAVIYAFADRLTSRATSAVRYAVALGALALMPLVVIITFAGEMRSLASPQITKTEGTSSANNDHPIQLPLIRQHSLTFAPEVESPSIWLKVRAERVMPWLDMIWMMGVLLLALRALGGWRQLERIRRTAIESVPAHVEQSFQRICARLQIGSKTVLRVSNHLISPMVMGIWKATVILPMSAVLQLSAEELEAVLAHELGHIRRWDYACNLLQTALETVLFFHPAVWWLSRAVRYQREVCCDEIAVKSCANAVVYAQTLLRLEEQKIAEVRLAAALRGGSGSLLGRIEKVLGEKEPMENRITSGVRVAVASAVVIGLLVGPKVSDAVAASRPIMDHAAALLPEVAASKPQAQSEPMKLAVKADVQVNEKVSVKIPETEASSAVIASLNDDAEGLAAAETQAEPKTTSNKGISYIDGMAAAGYPLDLNKDLNTLVSLKSLGVTPEYAKQMGELGFGKPSVHELISLKALGVTLEYVAELKQSGIGPKDFHEVTTEKALGITPEYAAEMKKTGFGDLNVQELISLKAQNVTPEYVSWLKQQFPQITLDELRRAAVFHLDDKFLAEAKSHGFDGKDLDKLLRLKMSGLLDE